MFETIRITEEESVKWTIKNNGKKNEVRTKLQQQRKKIVTVWYLCTYAKWEKGCTLNDEKRLTVYLSKFNGGKDDWAGIWQFCYRDLIHLEVIDGNRKFWRQ